MWLFNLYPIIMSKAPVLSLLTMAIYSEEELSTVPPQNPEWCLRDLLWELLFYSFTYWSGFLGVEPITPKVSGWEQEVFFSQQMLEAAHLAEAQSDCPQSLCWRLAQVLPRDTDTELLSESTTGSQRQWLIANHAGPGPWGETPAQRHDYERQGERGDHGYLPQSFMQLKLAKSLLYADPVLNVKLIDLSNSQCSLLFLLCGFTPASSTSLKRALFFKVKKGHYSENFCVYIRAQTMCECVYDVHACMCVCRSLCSRWPVPQALSSCSRQAFFVVCLELHVTS